ncbi:MAG: PQQ-dependent sugar dehydrogenase [Gammaproteobacteria bacterium]|nr:PQQ-dependent sugar dehydrogenase [Gammaproteobacteria bacterium]
MSRLILSASCLAALSFVGIAGSFAAATSDPFPTPIVADEDVIVVEFTEFARIPSVDGEAARMMTMIEEPGTGRMFLSDQRGMLYNIGDGGEVSLYLDVNQAVSVAAPWREMGVQSFAFHPQFAEAGTPGYGKFYIWSDTPPAPDPDFKTSASSPTHDTVLWEWAAADAHAKTYGGAEPREVVRMQQPYANHNGGGIAFNPLAEADDPDFGLLYIGNGDGGSGGDPLGLALDLRSSFGKILRIDPLGSNSTNGQYGVPADNPFAGEGQADALGEIYAYGLRNPQHLVWDVKTGDMLVSDIGQNTVEEVSIVTRGANLGWNDWEGSFRFVGRGGVDDAAPRGDAGVSFPFVEYDQQDPLFGDGVAVTGLHVVRNGAISALQDRVLFGELVSGELFYVDADDRPDGGQEAIRRVLFDDGSGEPRTLLDLVREKNRDQGRDPVNRVDLRLGAASGGRIFLLNKHDGTLRMLVPPNA